MGVAAGDEQEPWGYSTCLWTEARHLRYFHRNDV
jgi:hypothetical protein